MPREHLAQFRRGTAAQWASVNPVLAGGEPGHELDTGAIKIGNGTDAWNDLPYTADTALQPDDLSATGLATYDDQTGVIDVPASEVESIALAEVAERISYAGQVGSLGLRPQHLDGWWDALHARASAPADMVLIGDSLMALSTGLGGAPAIGQHVERLLSNERPVQTPAGIAGWRCANPAGGAGGLAPAFTTCEGTPTTSAVAALGMAMSAGHTATIIDSMDGISLVYASAPGAGSIEVRDGGPSGTLLDTIDADTTANSSQVWTSGALSLASHTIHLTITGGPVTVSGAMVHRRNRASGVRVWNCSGSGSTTTGFTDNPERALDLIDTIGPDLVVLATGTNDGGASNYDTRMRLLVAEVRDRHAGPIALWIPHLSNNVDTDVVAAAYAIAADFDLGVVDASELIGVPIEASGLSGVGVHQNAAGGQLEAMHLAAALSGDPVSSLARMTRHTNAAEWTNGVSTATVSPQGGSMEYHTVNGTEVAHMRPQYVQIADGTSQTTVYPYGVNNGTQYISWTPSGAGLGTALSQLFGAPDGRLALGKIALTNLDADPAGVAAVGEIVMVQGVIKVCTTAGTPGTWTALAFD